jgi:hypothetical protein
MQTWWARRLPSRTRLSSCSSLNGRTSSSLSDGAGEDGGGWTSAWRSGCSAESASVRIRGGKRAFFEAPAVERMTGKATLLPAIQKESARR